MHDELAIAAGFLLAFAVLLGILPIASAALPGDAGFHDLTVRCRSREFWRCFRRRAVMRRRKMMICLFDGQTRPGPDVPAGWICCRAGIATRRIGRLVKRVRGSRHRSIHEWRGSASASRCCGRCAGRVAPCVYHKARLPGSYSSITAVVRRAPDVYGLIEFRAGRRHRLLSAVACRVAIVAAP